MRRVLDPGRNCDPLVKAKRFALLVDGAAYYGTLAHSVAHARRTVVIVGWDLDSRVRLGPGVVPPGIQLMPSLREFLSATADGNPHLDIYILNWNFPLLFANVRDPKLVAGRDPFRHPRVHFQFDSTHASGGSHHQKIVVIDDCLAFAGGMDVAGGRWDTPEHRAYDIRRSGKHRPYPPSHDVQAMVDGEAARALAAIVRERWYRSTGTSVPACFPETDIWPDHVTPDLENVSVGISRTDVGADGRSGRLEIERLHLDLIEAARQFIYVENQYLTSDTIVTALCRRLHADEGPEVLIVLPLKNSGWLEERTFEVLRFRSMRRLREADRFGRLRICYPVVPDLDGEAVQVHSKVLAIDDRLFRVGSSNLTNRSMRLDTECDLTIEATNTSQRRGVADLRNRLLAEHLGVSAEAIDAFLRKDASLIRLVDSRRAESRCLREAPSDTQTTRPLIDDELIDPSRPIDTGLVIEALATSAGVTRKAGIPAALVVVATTLSLLALWRMIKATSPRATRQRADGRRPRA
jgi:phospholipase D1/2